MAMGLVGTKYGMTRVFNEDGSAESVTVIHISEHKLVEKREDASHGYTGVQLVCQQGSKRRLNKAETGHLAKANLADAGACLRESRVSQDVLDQYEVGQSFTVSLFEEIGYVDVSGISKGKGFAGTVKRWNFKTQDATHGNSLSHRKMGSTGQCQDPGRVFPGKKMPGQMGNVKTTSISLKVVKVDAERGVILVRGSVPGPVGRQVVVRESVKRPGVKK